MQLRIGRLGVRVPPGGPEEEGFLSRKTSLAAFAAPTEKVGAGFSVLFRCYSV